MPDRIVRAAILTSEPVNQLSWPAEVFYRRLFSVVDDHGRYDGRPTLLRAHLYPLKIDRVSDADVGKWLTECVNADLVSVYQVSDRPFLEVRKFGQRVRSETSKWPDPPADGSGPPSSAVKCQQMTALVVDVDVDVDDKTRAPSGADLFPGISPQVVADFTRLRKAKKAAITATAVAGLKREAAKANLTLESVLSLCCERGWSGFNAAWVQGNNQPAAKTRNPL